jgi:hypothetical protein
MGIHYAVTYMHVLKLSLHHTKSTNGMFMPIKQNFINYFNNDRTKFPMPNMRYYIFLKNMNQYDTAMLSTKML